MSIWIILALVVAAVEIFGKKKTPQQPPKQNQAPRGYQEYDAEERAEYNQQDPKQSQGTPTGLPKWLDDAMKGSMPGSGQGDWQKMAPREPITEAPRPIVKPKPVMTKPKVQVKTMADSRPVAAAPTIAPQMEIQNVEIFEDVHHIFVGKNVEDIKEVIILSELLGPPLALRKQRRLI